MKKDQKTEGQISAEKQEVAELIKNIMECTATIPKKILNEASYQAAVQFKAAALDARKAAESTAPRLAKLRSAWQSIQHYY